MPFKRIAAAAAAALLAVVLVPAPARADGSHECFSGERGPDGSGGYTLTAWGCAGTGYADVMVSILFGVASGTYTCASVFPWNGTLSGTGCRLS
ncbi:hypothetical protein [Nonomuraea sp. NPDC002799]